MSKDRKLVLLSGGMDSLVALHRVKKDGDYIQIAHCDTGNRTIENCVKMSCLVSGYNYYHQAKIEEYLLNTPYDLMLYISAAVSLCRQNSLHSIVLGITRDDKQYNKVFFARLNNSLAAIDKTYSIKIETPFINKTKAQVARMSSELGYQCCDCLSYSYSPFLENKSTKDKKSIARINAFKTAGLPDPMCVRLNMEEQIRLPKTSNYSNIKVATTVDILSDRSDYEQDKYW